MRYLYLAPWEWRADSDISYWRAPNGDALGCFDLRSLPQQALAGGTPQGYGLFVYDYDPALPGSLMLGTGLERLQVAKNRLQNALGVTLDASSPREVLWEILTTRADPTGQTRWKPLRGSLRRPTRMGLDPSLEASMGPEILNATVGVFQADYRRNKADGVPLEALRRWTGSEMQKLYGRMSDGLAASILPSEYEADGWAVPKTVVTDNFTGTDGTDLVAHDANWAYLKGTAVGDAPDFEINTNAVRQTSGSLADTAAWAKYGSNLSGDDHYAEMTIEALTAPASTRSFGAAVARMSENGFGYVNGYAHEATIDSSSVKRGRLAKYVGSGGANNSPTLTVLVDAVETINLTDAIRAKTDGSDISGLIAGVTTAGPVADSAITGVLTGGIGSRITQGSVGDILMDNFEAADLAAAATPSGSVVPLMAGMGFF